MVNILNLRLLVLLGPDYHRLTERLCTPKLCCTGNHLVVDSMLCSVPVWWEFQGQVFDALIVFPFYWLLVPNTWMNVSCLFIDYYFKIFIPDVHRMLNFLMQVVYKGKYIFNNWDILFYCTTYFPKQNYFVGVCLLRRNFFFLLPQNTNCKPVFSSVVTLVMILASHLFLD